MTDRRVFLFVVLFLGGTLLVTVGGIAVLAGLDKSVPGILENVAVGCLTGLAGLLARGPSDEPQEVRVTNRGPAEAVPTEDAGYSLVEVMVAAFFAVLIVVVLVRLL